MTVTATPTESEPSATPTEDPFAPNVGARALNVGQTREGKSIVTTLKDVKYPDQATQPYRRQPAGMQFLGMMVRSCLRNNPEDNLQVSWFDFEARDRAGGRYPWSGNSWSGYPSPQFPTVAILAPGECVQGWMLLEVPEGAKVDRVALMNGGGSGATAAEWRI